MDYSSLVHLLRHVKQFEELDPQHIQAIAAAGAMRTFSQGAHLFHEEEACAGLFVLLSGQVQLQKAGLDGKVYILRMLEPVTVFNEVPALDSGPNAVTAVAGQEKTTVWQISAEGLQKVILRYPQLGLGMLRVLAANNRYLVSQYQDLTMRPVLARCAKLIYELSEKGQQPIQRRKHPNHQMAARIATVPELFSRSLRTLREAGMISITSQLIVVLDANRLGQTALISPRSS